MNQRNLVIGLLVFVVLAFGGLIAYDMKYGHKFEKRFGGNKQAQNWKWEDDWNGKNAPTPPPERIPTPPGPSPVLPEMPSQQLIAGSYQEALKKSGETGRPVLVFFTAEWCSWCKKMKSETMVDSKVQAALKNYIMVYVDTDKDRAPARKFGIESLPSYVITNVKEDKLKFDNGYKSVDSFTSWLNDPSLYNQPKASPDSRPQPQQQPQPQRRTNPQNGSPPNG